MGTAQSTGPTTTDLSGNHKFDKKSRNAKHPEAQASDGHQETQGIKRSSKRQSQPIAKKPPPNKRRTDYEELITESGYLKNIQNNEEAERKPRDPKVDTSDMKQPETEKIRPVPPTENVDIIPLFPGKNSLEKKQSHKGESNKTKIIGDQKENDQKKDQEAADGEVNNESGEIEYYEHQLEFNVEDSEKNDSESDYDSDSTKSRSRSTSRWTSRTSVQSHRKRSRSYSSGSESSTITSGSERAHSKARSKATEKTTVPSDSDREKEESDHENVDDKKEENDNDTVTDHLTSQVYVVPETKPHEKKLDTKAERVPPEENVFVIHLFEKD